MGDELVDKLVDKLDSKLVVFALVDSNLDSKLVVFALDVSKLVALYICVPTCVTVTISTGAVTTTVRTLAGALKHNGRINTNIPKPCIAVVPTPTLNYHSPTQRYIYCDISSVLDL